MREESFWPIRGEFDVTKAVTPAVRVGTGLPVRTVDGNVSTVGTSPPSDRLSFACDPCTMEFITDKTSKLFELLQYFFGKRHARAQTIQNNNVPRRHPFERRDELLVNQIVRQVGRR